MRTLTLILFLGLLASALPAQPNHSIPGLELMACKVKSERTQMVEICGILSKVSAYPVSVKTRLQTTCNMGFPDKNEYESLKSKFLIYTLPDTNCQYHDSIYAAIARYWEEKELSSNKYNLNGNFQALSVSTGLVHVGNHYVPFISTDHERDGAYAIFCWSERVYKVELVESKGMGALSNFVDFCVLLAGVREDFELDGMVRMLDVTKDLIAKQKDQCPQDN